jgi:hypothetical protein
MKHGRIVSELLFSRMLLCAMPRIAASSMIGSLALALVLLSGNVTDAYSQETDVSTSVATDDTADASPDTESRTPTTPKSQPDAGAGSRGSDQNQARENERRGNFLPYGVLRRKARAAVSGDVVRVRLLKRVQGPWYYEFTFLDDKGKYMLVSVDAGTGNILSKRKR